MVMNLSGRYQEQIAKGLVKADPAQAEIVRVLDEVAQQLQKVEGRREKGDIFSRLFSPLSPLPSQGPKGIYIYGPVGRGKSMLMDLFFECAPIEPKRRVHFHAFMQELHHYLHLGRQTKIENMDDALLGFAKHVAREAHLLCFDEFHVVDVADAMLLGRLFHALWELGVITVATSNWAPDNLYKDGLQRDRFLPFIAELKSRLTVCELKSDTDYRLARLRGYPVYYTPLDANADERMEFLFHDLTAHTEIAPLELHLPGRRWVIPRAAKGIVWLEYEDACAAARGAPDYLELATCTQVVFINHIPTLTDEMRNEIKRFIMLIDILYENHVRVVISATADATKLYPIGTHTFEFERTISRLMEMQSAEYLAGALQENR